MTNTESDRDDFMGKVDSTLKMFRRISDAFRNGDRELAQSLMEEVCRRDRTVGKENRA